MTTEARKHQPAVVHRRPRAEKVIDLRVPTTQGSRFVATVTGEHAPPDVVATAFIEEASFDTADWPAGPELDGWRGFVTALAPLTRTNVYVGTLRVAAKRAAAIARAFPSQRDVQAAALILLDTTAAYAHSTPDFESGLANVQRIDQRWSEPRAAVTLLEMCIQRASTNPDAAALGLDAAMVLLSRSPGGVLDARDLWVFRAALALASPEALSDEAMRRLSRHDRTLLQSLLHGDSSRLARRLRIRR